MRMMKNQYKHLFFDWDKTLWDYDLNVKRTLAHLYDYYKFQEIPNFTKEAFFDKYIQNINRLWKLYDQDKIDKKIVRQQRFHAIDEIRDSKNSNFLSQLNEHFLYLCPRQKGLIEGAREIIEKLSDHFTLHILTNGFQTTQTIKIEQSGLQDYFELIITSESTKYKKPNRKIYDYALEESKAQISEVLMIGDSLENDVIGAQKAGWNQVYFNPKKIEIPKNINLSYEITSLKELETLLL